MDPVQAINPESSHSELEYFTTINNNEVTYYTRLGRAALDIMQNWADAGDSRLLVRLRQQRAEVFNTIKQFIWYLFL